MKNLQNHIRNYELIEDSCNALFSSVLISDKQLKTPTTGFLLINIVQCIESIAKDLHKELAPLFPKLPKFHAGEQFDYDALGFLDQALGLSKKQIKITSKLMPSLSEEKRLITPLLGAHESLDKHPAWSKAYQSNKHDLANSQNADLSASSLGGKASIPSTIQAEIEAAGAAFLLLTVAKSLPLNKETPYDQCDFTFGSDIFTATYTRPLFNCFAGPMSKDCLQFGPNWEQQLFVVKDPEPYIAHLRAKSKANEAQLLQEINKDRELVAFLHKAEEERPKTSTPLLIFEYGQQTGDQAKKKWCQRINNLSFSTNIEYFTAWANGEYESLRLFGFAPVVALNYQDADHLYDYEKLSQDNPDSNNSHPQ